MPTYTYPGVYIQEIPSGVHTITGVSTSNTAFVDFFPRGPVDEAVEITSFGDFERIFGGLDARSESSYGIMQYYLNGGQTAFVVRVAPGALTASGWLEGSSPPQHSLLVSAASAGAWGNFIDIAVDHNIDPQLLAADATLFNLVAREFQQVGTTRIPVSVETYRNLSMNKLSPRYALTVVNPPGGSSLIQLGDGGGLGAPPNPTGTDVIGDAAHANPLALSELAGPRQAGGDGDAPPAPNALPAGNWATLGAAALVGSEVTKTGMHALDRIEPSLFNLLCLPAAANLSDSGQDSVYSNAEAYCLEKRAFVILDIPKGTTTAHLMSDWLGTTLHGGLRHQNAAVYFPRLRLPDPLSPAQPRDVGASGTLAGIYARTDSTRGVWKAPAGIEATLVGVSGLTLTLNDLENGQLNPLGINVLRNFPVYGMVSWGGRTLRGADQLADEWKYIPVRRTALFIEESLFEGTKWVVFEPNDEPLWAQIRLNVGAFMHDLFRQGAFQGKSPQEAYFVKCDRETTTQNDINLGIVNILVGFAPLKPAEFVVIKLQQIAGQVAV
jgi:phage tail sheath protein FI